ncbi:MAG: NAD(P)-binding domain-containing protein [Actinomycetota bacterium]|nr:NAD(P)-binding domain-containing protein [Actinomycetota bacterium]
MKVGVLGTGSVGKTVGAKLVELGHEVMMGSRSASNPVCAAWAEEHGERARHGTFTDAAAFGEVVVNATAGTGSLEALRQAGADNLSGKLLVDIANALDFSRGMPPSLAVVNTDSVGERIQREFPEARVVKTLNTVTAAVMVDPGRLAGSHSMFMAGNDGEAKAQARTLLRELGWPDEAVIDLGGIESARGMEMYLPLWLSLMGALGTPNFNILVQREG